MASIMLSDRKVHKRTARLTDYYSLIDEIKLKFKDNKLSQLSLTYKFDNEQEEIQLLNDQSIDAIRKANKNTRIFICKTKLQKSQSSGIWSQSNLERSRINTQMFQKSSQILNNSDIKKQQIDYQLKQKVERQEPKPYRLIEVDKHIEYQQENLYCHVGVSCMSCKCMNIVGNRYKCQVCPDYNLCTACYKIKQQNNTHQPSHKFYIIRNGLFFNSINYYEIFAHFFGYKFKEYSKGNMSLRQFNGKNHKFYKQIQYYREKIVQQLDENLQNWQKQFQAQLNNK